MEKIRVFIALELSEEIKGELARLQDELKHTEADVKWVKPENIHLTLKFLGHITEEKVAHAKEVLTKIASSSKPFIINLFKLGCFPRLESPQVIWVGIEEGCAETEEIAKRLESELEGIGFEKEKRSFSAHLTLGRVRSGKNKTKLVEKIKTLQIKPSTTASIRELTLFKSALTPKGSIYTVLHKARFNQ